MSLDQTREDLMVLGVPSWNPVTGALSVNGVPISNQPPNWYNVKTAGATGLGLVSDSDAIATRLDDIPLNIQYANGRYSEGGILYFPGGGYRMDSLLDLSSGQTSSGRRMNVTLQGDGAGATVLFTDLLTNLMLANTAVDNLTFRDLTIYCGTQFTGLGTLEKLIDLFGCTRVLFERVEIRVTKSVARNTDCVLLNLDQCWESSFINSMFSTNINASTEYHNVTGAANTGVFGGTHIRSRDTNSFKWFGCRSEFAYRAVHLVNDEGAAIIGGHLGACTQGFLFDGSSGCEITEVRSEVHPEDPVYGQYDGPDKHFIVAFDETSRYNKVRGGFAWMLKSKLPEYGYIDKNGTNMIELTNAVTKSGSMPLNRNGNFAMGPYTDTTVKIPGWTLFNGSTLTEELTDLPPEHGITRALRIATTANGSGVSTKAFTIDSKRVSTLLWKTWLKRAAGDHVQKLVLTRVASGNPVTADLIPAMRGYPEITAGKTGLVISGTPTWAGGELTIASRTKHFLKVNQMTTLAGFSVTAGTDPDGSHLVTAIVDDYIFKISTADPGTIVTVGTYARTGRDDITDPDEWAEHKGVIEVRQFITGWQTSGANVIFTCSWAHMVENSVTDSIQLWGFADPLWNATHTIVSSGGVGSVTFTIARPVGAADPIDVSSGNSAWRVDGSAWTGTAFYGWAGMTGSYVMEFRSVFTTGVHTSAENLVSGFVLQPMSGSLAIQDSYLPGVETFVGKKTYDWPNCVAGGTQSTTVTVPGAAVGDSVTFGLSVDDVGLQKSAAVLSTGVATCVIRNPTGADINLAAGCVITATVMHVY